MTRLHWLGQVPVWGAILSAIVAGALCFWLYRRETSLSESKLAKLLPWLRSIAVGLIVFMLTEPALQHRYREGEPGILTIVVDDSESMTLFDGRDKSRYDRAVERLLSGDSEILSRLAEEHDVRLLRGSSEKTTELWRATVEEEAELPTSTKDWSVEKYQARSRLGELISKDDSSVLVLLSDGRVNEGASLSEIAQNQEGSKRTIFTVGLGADKPPPELSIVSVEHPDRLFRRDRLTGKILLSDSKPAGEEFRLQAMHGDEVVWEQVLRTDGSGQRAVAFSFPIDPLIKKAGGANAPESNDETTKVSAVPLDVRFRCLAGNQETGRPYDIQLWGALHRSKILLVDGRSRWESRYLKNVFDRDPFWEITPVIAEAEDILGGGPHLPIGRDQSRFPESRDELLQYDLIVLGDLPLESFSDEQQEWLVDFVSDSGGGLVVVDGQRDGWANADETVLGALLPVERVSLKESAAVERSTVGRKDPQTLLRVGLTSAGKNLPALDIRVDEQTDAQEFWQGLPPLHWSANTKALPGAEVLATLTSLDPSKDANAPNETRGQGELPFLVTRMVGAGRVLYLSGDETWRWRYKVADQIHQRFWNQTARWMMRTPYVAEGEYVSLDAGRMNYAEGQSVELRCRLRKENNEPIEKADVQAIIASDGQSPLMIAMEPHPEIPGVYRGTVNNLAAGSYRMSVSAIGVPKETLEVSTRFNVLAKTSIELNEKSMDVLGLKRIAEATGGEYLTEEMLPKLVEKLQPFSQGKIVESETLLWQSYFWFVPVILLLGLEWLIRKRVGLI